MADPQVTAVPIRETGEEILDIRDGATLRVSRSRADSEGAFAYVRKQVLDRLTQIKPRWLFMDDVAVYNGKTVDLRGKMTDIVKGMDGVSEFDGVVSMPRFDDPADVIQP